MKKIIFLLLSLAAVVSTATAADNNTIWHSADTLPLIGKGIDPASTAMRYQRLPDSMKTRVTRDAVYYLGTNSAGMAIRFASDAPAIDIKWKSLYKNLMNHQTPTGTRGLDLYTLLPDSSWTFVNSARPNLNDHTTSTNVIANMDPVMREYLLYLPLYDGIDSLYIGAGKDFVVTSPKVDILIPGSEATPDPIVMYGTSLLQGGCANRPGMAHTNIITRRLNRPVINFGFSGNGQLDLEIAEILAAIPNPAMYVLDFVPNVNEQQIEEQMIPFVEIIEKAHPGVPILFPEDPRFPHMRFDHKMRHEVNYRNLLMKGKFDILAQRYPNLVFLPSIDFAGHDNEAFVDGIHYTDLGFLRYADVLEPILREMLRNAENQK